LEKLHVLVLIHHIVDLQPTIFNTVTIIRYNVVVIELQCKCGKTNCNVNVAKQSMQNLKNKPTFLTLCVLSCACYDTVNLFCTSLLFSLLSPDFL